MQVFLYLIFYYCIGGHSVHLTMSVRSHNLKDHTYVEYFEGQALNSLTLYDDNYRYQNGEMEREEYGTYQYDTLFRQLRLKREQIIYPNGFSEEDCVLYQIDVPNDSILVYRQRIACIARGVESDTVAIEGVFVRR